MQPRSNPGDGKPVKKYYSARKKFCAFCKDKITLIDYKNHKNLENYISETGRIFPARVSGTCAYHQKQLSKAIKRARQMALIKFTEEKKRLS
jgi:small subunit ribosomal protein S18